MHERESWNWKMILWNKVGEVKMQNYIIQKRKRKKKESDSEDKED